MHELVPIVYVAGVAVVVGWYLLATFGLGRAALGPGPMVIAYAIFGHSWRLALRLTGSSGS